MAGTGRDRPFDDAARLAALADYRVLDTEAESAFDNLTKLAAKIFGTPISLVSLIDERRQWFKSRQGLDISETPREHAFCDHAIRADDTLVVADAWQDERFAKNPLVLGEPRIRFYCGVPLHTPEGHGLGTLCIIDHEPRAVDREQIAVLQGLARQVEIELEIRRRVVVLEERLVTVVAKAKSRELLATMIVHDMRGPLTAITMLASLVAPATDEARTHLDLLLGEAERLRHMLLDILDVCLHDVCGLRPRRRTFDGGALARDLAARLQRAAPVAGTRVVVEGDGPEWLHADPELLLRVLENLIGNAIQHAPAAPRVTVRFRPGQPGRRLIEVSDRGTVIPESQRDAVFEPLTRGATALHRGHGLGLAFCRLAVEAHGCTIGVRPSSDGVGNTFSFEMPAPPG